MLRYAIRRALVLVHPFDPLLLHAPGASLGRLLLLSTPNTKFHARDGDRNLVSPYSNSKDFGFFPFDNESASDSYSFDYDDAYDTPSKRNPYTPHQRNIDKSIISFANISIFHQAAKNTFFKNKTKRFC